MAGACIAGRGVALMACAFACDPRAKFHTSGGPRRRPCLGKGRGRRILHGNQLFLGTLT